MPRITTTTLDPATVLQAATHVRAEWPHLRWRQALLFAADEVARGRLRSGPQVLPSLEDVSALEAELAAGLCRGITSDPIPDDDAEPDPDPELIELSGSLRVGLVLRRTLDPTDAEVDDTRPERIDLYRRTQ
jgi:hypothetical protein